MILKAIRSFSTSLKCCLSKSSNSSLCSEVNCEFRLVVISSEKTYRITVSFMILKTNNNISLKQPKLSELLYGEGQSSVRYELTFFI